jgi:hypothetical protein
MNTKFDELTKGIAQSVTRRAALKKFGIGLAGMALACFGLANRAKAVTCREQCSADCGKRYPLNSGPYQMCNRICVLTHCNRV